MALIFGCAKSAKEDLAKPTGTIEVKPKVKQIVSTENKEWYMDLIENYIANSKKDLIVSDRESGKIEWILDDTRVNDTANYYIFNIGHTETDNGENPRFTSDGWVYIDSLTQKIYEEDLSNEKLILWKNN